MTTVGRVIGLGTCSTVIYPFIGGEWHSNKLHIQKQGSEEATTFFTRLQVGRGGT